MKTLVCIACFLSVGIAVVSAVTNPTFESDPEGIDVGFDRTLELAFNCSYSGSFALSQLNIIRNDGTTRTYVSLDVVNDVITLEPGAVSTELPANASATSDIGPLFDVELILTIPDPGLSFAGTYECEPRAVDSNDDVFLRSTVIIVTEVELDVRDLVDRFIALNDTVNGITDTVLNLEPAPVQLNFTDEVNDLLERNANLTEGLDDATARLGPLEDAIADTVCLANFTQQEVERIDRVLYVESDVYGPNGNRYLLSQFTPVSYNQAELACAFKSGVLAEPNDEAEYNFIQTFLAEQLSFQQLALIGLVTQDDGSVTYKSGLPANFTDFFTLGQNGGPLGDNCVALGVNFLGEPGIKMLDVNCKHLSPTQFNFVPAYLCEVPDTVDTCP